MFAQGHCELLDLKKLVNMGRSVHMTVYKVVTSGSDPYGRHLCDQISLQLLTDSCVIKNLQGSYLTWLSLAESVLASIELSDGAVNQHELLSKLKQMKVSFVDGRELNRTLLQLMLLARSMFDCHSRQRFWLLEVAYKDVFSMGNSEKLRMLLLACKKHADFCQVQPSQLLAYVLGLMRCWLMLRLKKAFPTTSLTSKGRSWVDLAVKSYAVVLSVHRVCLQTLLPDHPILAVVEKFKACDFLQCLTQPVPSSEALEAEVPDSPEESFDMSCEISSRRIRSRLSHMADSMTFGPEESSAMKQIGTFLLFVVLGGYHGDLLRTRDVSAEYFRNNNYNQQESAVKNGFAIALSDVLSVIDKEGESTATKENVSKGPSSVAPSPAVTPESFLKGNFELLVLKFGGKGKKGRRVQDLDEAVRHSIAGPANLPSEGNPLRVLFVFAGECLKEDPYMPWSRPTRSITKQDDMMVSDIFNYIYQSLQAGHILDCFLQ